MNKLLRFLRPYWAAVLLAPLFMILEVSMDLLQPRFMASIVNDGVMTGDIEMIWSIGIRMIIVALIGFIGGAGCTYFSSKASQNFGADIRQALFNHVQTVSFRDIDSVTTGSLITRLTSDVVQVQNLVLMALRMMVRSPMILIGSIIMAFLISPRLTIILAITLPILLVVLITLMRLTIPMFAKVQDKLDRVNTVLQENLLGIRAVKAFVRSDYERERFAQANTDYYERALKTFRTIAINMPLMMLVLNMAIVAVLWFGGAETWNSSIAVGDLMAYLNYMTQILFALINLGMLIMNISRAVASAARINEVLEHKPEMERASKYDARVIQQGEVVFDHVSFGYDLKHKDSILKSIDLVIKPGQTVAILGATGSGKSSLVNLIPRLYDPTAGRVLIDGHDVKDIDPHELRSRVGMVLQQSLLFSGTIRDNIRYGRPEATQEEVESAARAAQAHDFIANMPDGYDTVIGQRGVNLSGGQKQRISIARALLVRPDILILDDSTSAVDLTTEAKIQAALRERMHNSTCIMIAQRISSVLEADNIIVLEHGEIAAQGTHEELIQHSKVYQDIYESQLRKEEVLHG